MACEEDGGVVQEETVVVSCTLFLVVVSLEGWWKVLDVDAFTSTVKGVFVLPAFQAL